MVALCVRLRGDECMPQRQQIVRGKEQRAAVYIHNGDEKLEPGKELGVVKDAALFQDEAKLGLERAQVGLALVA